MATKRASAAGFTLLEVMVALAILGLALTAILSAQAGLYDVNVQARNLSIGTTAARCKMTELEELLLKDGYPEIDQTDEGPCCADESPTGVTCKWAIERVVLPDPVQTEGGDGGVSSGDGGGSSGGGLGGLGALMSAGQSPGSIGDGGIGALSQMLSAGSGPNGQPGVNGIAGMAMMIVYPQLKPMLEASIRRITVEVVWNEGPKEREIKLVQFVTNPQKGLPPAGLLDAGVPGATTGPGGPGGANGVPGLPGGLPGLPGGLPGMGLPGGVPGGQPGGNAPPPTVGPGP